MSIGFVDLTKVIPPKMAGATLSACSLPHASFSPSNAYGINSSGLNGFPSKWFIPTTAPTELAAELPMPLPGLIFLSILISKPKSGFNESIKASEDTPATFFFTSYGTFSPIIEVI